MAPIEFQTRLSTQSRVIAAFLTEALAQYGPDDVAAAMRYALQGGKGLRGFLVLEASALYGIAAASALPAAGAVEAIHAYSLIHDDLPCMDDDDLRRGQPTVHKKWNEAIAVLAGDALQSFAFTLLADPNLGAAEVRIKLVSTLAEAAGARGMVLGQAQDIAAETAASPLTLEQITELQSNKTGALLEWPAHAAAIIAGQDPAPLRAYTRAIGLAFQIADDILDVEGDSSKAGKALRKDADAGKATFVTLLGLDGAKAEAARLVAEAETALAPFGDKAQSLRDLARFIIARDR